MFSSSVVSQLVFAEEMKLDPPLLEETLAGDVDNDQSFGGEE
jgi:hypothetical protein